MSTSLRSETEATRILSKNYKFVAGCSIKFYLMEKFGKYHIDGMER